MELGERGGGIVIKDRQQGHSHRQRNAGGLAPGDPERAVQDAVEGLAEDGEHEQALDDGTDGGGPRQPRGPQDPDEGEVEDEVEEKIKKAAEDLKVELHKDLREASRRK